MVIYWIAGCIYLIDIIYCWGPLEILRSLSCRNWEEEPISALGSTYFGTGQCLDVQDHNTIVYLAPWLNGKRCYHVLQILGHDIMMWWNSSWLWCMLTDWCHQYSILVPNKRCSYSYNIYKQFNICLCHGLLSSYANHNLHYLNEEWISF